MSEGPAWGTPEGGPNREWLNDALRVWARCHGCGRRVALDDVRGDLATSDYCLWVQVVDWPGWRPSCRVLGEH